VVARLMGEAPGRNGTDVQDPVPDVGGIN
jgi:hypothetical protein